jgi:hypothetical protein
LSAIARFADTRSRLFEHWANTAPRKATENQRPRYRSFADGWLL